jgi:lysophospholipid acyltransferase (LPLAT)-like uncharacterized protein
VRLPAGAGRWLGIPVVAALAATWRIRVVGGEFERAARASGRGVLYTIWHETLLPLVWHHRTWRDMTMLVSPGIDGDYLEAFSLPFGYRVIRGATGQAGVAAARALADVLAGGRPAAIAPDGPLGPRRTVTPGAVTIAQRAGALILPLHATADRGWRAGSWDRFLIPKPGSVVTVRYAEPFAVGEGSSGVAAATAQLAVALEGLTREDVA